MAKNLVIVESPAKAKTIEKFLGKDFVVASSFGHISDLPSKELGVDVDGDFLPKYEISKDKKAVVKKLKDLAKKSEMVWLASDEDREGEAIAWHLYNSLKLSEEKTKRIVFHEITESAIKNAVANPRKINYNLVDAQQARRVLDRIVGYELSPVLWRKIRSGLSAGRVQSVSVRLIVEKEREILSFTPVSSFKIDCEFKTIDGSSFKARLPKTFNSKDDALVFINKNINSEFSVKSLEKKPTKKSAAPPFTTSTLQQEASRKLYFSVSKTMTIAQRLYEAGLITYMRTDSVNLSNDAKESAKNEIIASYGESYSSPKVYKGKVKGAQDAHEAIRPTDFSRKNLSIERDQARLYDLIWKRAIASQMSDAKLERTNVKIQSNKHSDLFTANGEIITFDGFLKVYIEGTDEENQEKDGLLPNLEINQNLINSYINATQRFSRPPYRFTEASLVKKLEELGIGRPSTYAPTISTIQNRGYIEKGVVEGNSRDYVQISLVNNVLKESKLSEKHGSDKGKLVPTDIGMIVTDFLVQHFQNILDYNFTAKVEQNFDLIAEGKKQWTSIMKSFYKDFHPVVEDVKENAERESGKRSLGVHPETNREVSVRLGKFGPMIQIGNVEDDEKPLFASLTPDMQISSVTIDEALDLFKLPKHLGEYENKEVMVSNGRFGPYIKHGSVFISLPKGVAPLSVSLEDSIEFILEKQKADAPIATYENLPVQKGKGRFGPFIKWNNMFINVNKKYDWDNLSQSDIIELIETKIQKDKDKIIYDWSSENIKVEKARWGRFNIISGKIKIELPKTFEIEKLTVEDAKERLSKLSSKKKKKK
jgi:DNA topoisomerase-1